MKPSALASRAAPAVRVLHVAIVIAVLCGGRSMAQTTSFASSSIGRQMQALWEGKAHFQEVRDIDWGKPPYNTYLEGAGWFANPMPLPDGRWYLFSRQAVRHKPSFCPADSAQVVVRVSSDRGRTWSNPAMVAAAPGGQGAPDACAIVDGSTYYDGANDTWHMLAQCLAANDAGGWSMCHYVRRGPSPMGHFTADTQPAVTGGELWARICANSRGMCDPRTTHDEGTPDIVGKRNGYFYVTFHGYSPPRGFRGVAKTADFHHWIVSGPDLPDTPIFAPPECQAWNQGCIGGGAASTLTAGDYQYMMIETPTINLACTPGQNWPIALLRAPKGIFPPWSSPLWQRFQANPLLRTAWPSSQSKCGIQYPRWAITSTHVYILYEDFSYEGSRGTATDFRRRLLELVPGAGPSVVLAAPASR
ncbi:MAG: hypothetical protein ACYC8V_04095 [Caulobacteraceae bacterium]